MKNRSFPKAIELFDVYCGCGGYMSGMPEIFDFGKCAIELKRVKIKGGLVRLMPEALETDVIMANQTVYQGCHRHPLFMPCPIVVPAVSRDFPDEEQQVAEHLRRGAAAVWIRPAADHWTTAPWCAGRLFAALEARRCPLFCLERMVSLEEVAAIAERHPRLPIILAPEGYRSGRSLMALLESFANVRLTLGAAFSIHRGIEQIVSIFGPERLLFGTGLPDAEPMSAVTQLLYAEISDQAKKFISAGNFKRLLKEIER